jgi:hypothetical protein
MTGTVVSTCRDGKYRCKVASWPECGLADTGLLSACHPQREIWAEADNAFRTVTGNTVTEFQRLQKTRGPFRSQ